MAGRESLLTSERRLNAGSDNRTKFRLPVCAAARELRRTGALVWLAVWSKLLAEGRRWGICDASCGTPT